MPFGHELPLADITLGRSKRPKVSSEYDKNTLFLG